MLHDGYKLMDSTHPYWMDEWREKSQITNQFSTLIIFHPMYSQISISDYQSNIIMNVEDGKWVGKC